MRCPDEKARFRGNDKAYGEGWDRIFGQKKGTDEKQTDTATSDTTRTELRHLTEDAAGLLLNDADERTQLSGQASIDS